MDHRGCTTRGRCEERACLGPQAAVRAWRPVPACPRGAACAGGLGAAPPIGSSGLAAWPRRNGRPAATGYQPLRGHEADSRAARRTVRVQETWQASGVRPGAGTPARGGGSLAPPGDTAAAATAPAPR